MNTDLTLRIDLELPAQRLSQHLKLYNEGVEKQVQDGITQALEEITNDNVLGIKVKNSVKEQIYKMVNQEILTWEFKDILRQKLLEKVGERLDEIAEKAASEVAKGMGLK